MAWPTYALASETETKTALRVQGTGQNTALEQLAAQATDVCEDIAERRFVERNPDPADGSQDSVNIIENHDLAVPQRYVYVRVRPIRVVTAVLVGNPSSLQTLPVTDYVIDTEQGMVILKTLSSGNLGIWGDWSSAWGSGVGGPFTDFPESFLLQGGRGPSFPPGVGVVQVKYTGGYAATANVTGELKQAFLDIFARIYRANERKSQGLIQEVAQGLSIGTKFDQNYVSPEAKAVLRSEGNFSKTARR